MTRESISFVVPCNHGFAEISRFLEAFFKVKTIGPTDELIFVFTHQTQLNTQSIQDRIIKAQSTLETTPVVRFMSASEAFPGEARNLGIADVKYDNVTFLDIGTLPIDSVNFRLAVGENVRLRATRFWGTNDVAKIMCGQTYGSEIQRITIPGSSFRKSVVTSHLGDKWFREGILSGEDKIFLQDLIQKKIILETPTSFTGVETATEYDKFPNTFEEIIIKYFKYALFSKFSLKNISSFILVAFVIILIAIYMEMMISMIITFLFLLALFPLLFIKYSDIFRGESNFINEYLVASCRISGTLLGIMLKHIVAVVLPRSSFRKFFK